MSSGVLLQKEGDIIITREDQELVKFMCDGLSATAIGKKMSLSARTVENRQSQLRVKTDCKNSAALVAYFFRNKLIE